MHHKLLGLEGGGMVGRTLGRSRPSSAGMLALFSLALLQGTARPAAAGADPHAFKGHYYELVADGVNWATAEATAKTFVLNGIRGHLVTISSQAENDFVNSLLGDNDIIWIGLTDADDEGVFKWVTGEPFRFENWDDGEPNNDGNEDCVELREFDDGEWNDASCSETRFYVVEFDANPAPAIGWQGLLLLAVLLFGASYVILARRRPDSQAVR